MAVIGKSPPPFALSEVEVQGMTILLGDGGAWPSTSLRLNGVWGLHPLPTSVHAEPFGWLASQPLRINFDAARRSRSARDSGRPEQAA